MMTPAAAAYHAKRIRELSDANDWAGLARHWMAHQHEAALEAAVALVRSHTGQDHRAWTQLGDLLDEVRENPFGPRRRPPESLLKVWTTTEEKTIWLLLMNSQVRLCELATQAPIEMQEQLFRVGVESAEDACRLSEMLHDYAAEAIFRFVLATGCLGLMNLDAACDNLEKALENYRKLAVQDPDIYEPYVAMTLVSLGKVQWDLHMFEASCASLQEALAQYAKHARLSPDAFQPQIATAWHNLANVQLDLNDLQAARASYQKAMTIFEKLTPTSPDYYLPHQAMTLNGLGNVQHRLNEIDAARGSYEEALAIRKRLDHEHPNVYGASLAMTLQNLANVQCDLNDLQAARASYRQALTIRRKLARKRPDIHLPYVAMSLNGLGVLQDELNDLEGARASFNKALGIYRKLSRQWPNVYDQAVAMVYHNLGALGHKLSDFAAASTSFKGALEIYRELARGRPVAYGPFLAGTLVGLSVVQRDLNDLGLARTSLLEAADLYAANAETQPTFRLQERQICWDNIGRLYLCESPELGSPDVHQARKAFRQARVCMELFRGCSVHPNARQRVQAQGQGVYERLIQTCVHIWQDEGDLAALQEAIEVGEASRARNLMEMLAEEALEPANTPPDLVNEFRALRKRLRAAQLMLTNEESRPVVADEPSSSSGTGAAGKSRFPGRRDGDLLHALGGLPRSAERVAYLRQEVERLQQQHAEQLQRIRVHDADFDPDRPFASIDFATAQRLVPDDVPSAIVQYTLTGERGLALVVTRSGVEFVPLPQLSHNDAIELANQWYNVYYHDRPNFDAAIPALLEPLSERAVQPVMDRLAGRGIARLILSPNRALHLFPLHACRLADGRYLADACEVAYTPSLSILHRCACRARPLRRELLLVENPTADLPFTEVEGYRLRGRYANHKRLYGSKATKEDVLKNAPNTHVLNYTGHAYFNPQHQLDSGLILGDKNDKSQWLTLRDIFCGLHLPNNCLTVINGCESGMLLPDQLDELVMLPSGFLYAGATCVLSTLWRVYDLSSALLVDRFHQEWLGENPDDPGSGRSIGAALREAQRWLREDIPNGVHLQRELLPDLLAGLQDRNVRKKCEEQAAFYARTCPDRPPFASPAHWAAFTAVGLAHPLAGDWGKEKLP